MNPRTHREYPQEGRRLDAKRHYVILAKALDGIWPVSHACVVLCSGTRRRRASAQHCTGKAKWPNTIQCLGSDDIMSLDIKASAFLRVEHPFAVVNPGTHRESRNLS